MTEGLARRRHHQQMHETSVTAQRDSIRHDGLHVVIHDED